MERLRRRPILLVATLYNGEHFFHPNDLKRYSLGTKNKSLKRNDDGSLTLYAGAKSPGKDKESNWLQSARTPQNRPRPMPPSSDSYGMAIQ